jgi:hypothetical protein
MLEDIAAEITESTSLLEVVIHISELPPSERDCVPNSLYDKDQPNRIRVSGAT